MVWGAGLQELRFNHHIIRICRTYHEGHENGQHPFEVLFYKEARARILVVVQARVLV